MGRWYTQVPPYKNFCRAGSMCPAVGAEKESPGHGFAVTAPFRQGGRGDADDPVAVPKIFALPYGGRLKF